MAFPNKNRVAKIPLQEFYMKRFRHVNVEQFFYVFQGDMNKLRLFCDKSLNAAAGVRNMFVPHSDKIIVTFTNGKCTNPAPCDSKTLADHICPSLGCPKLEFFEDSFKCTGTFKGNSLTFNMLVRQKNGQVFAYELFGFTDETTTFHHLRDVISQNYNLSKIENTIIKGRTSRELSKLNLIINAMKPVSNDTGLPVTITSTWTPFLTISANEAALPAMMAPLGFPFGTGFISPSDFIGISNFLNLTVPRVTLRQFRGTESTLRAVYKSILCFMPNNVKISEFGELGTQSTLEFSDVNSIVETDCPLREDLGLKKISTSIKAFRLLVSYTYTGKRIIWDGVKN